MVGAFAFIGCMTTIEYEEIAQRMRPRLVKLGGHVLPKRRTGCRCRSGGTTPSLVAARKGERRGLCRGPAHPNDQERLRKRMATTPEARSDEHRRDEQDIVGRRTANGGRRQPTTPASGHPHTLAPGTATLPDASGNGNGHTANRCRHRAVASLGQSCGERSAK